jgi:hypothetical protein
MQRHVQESFTADQSQSEVPNYDRPEQGIEPMLESSLRKRLPVTCRAF